MLLSIVCISASAKTVANGQNVETVFFYVMNQNGQEVLLAQLPIDEMEKALVAGEVSNLVHNYSVLDHYVTPVHQEAQGFTVNELLEYARSKTTSSVMKSAPLTFAGSDTIAFWEMEQTGYDEEDTYTYDELYGVQRYNYPLMYEYWNFKTQDFYDPAGEMSREQVIDHIFANAEPEYFVLSVRGFSQRYMITRAKYDAGDYDMQNYWDSLGKLDSARALRMMVGMTEEQLRNGTETASDTRFWVQNVRLTMASAPDIKPQADIAAPTGVMYQGANGDYYVTLSCDSEGASIYYNHNYANSGYMPTAEYTETLRIPATYVKNGTLTLNVRAVKDGCTDAGITTLKLTSSGAYEGEEWENPFSDVSSTAWYYDAVSYVNQAGLYNGTGATTFSPESVMNRAMFVTVLHRYAGTPAAGTSGTFTDVPAGQWYTDGVEWAAANAIVNGTGNNQFSPTGDITLEAIMTVLYRYVGGTAVGSVPTKYGTVSTWAADAMAWAESEKLFDGVGGVLSAKGAATRAQVAAILMNYAD